MGKNTETRQLYVHILIFTCFILIVAGCGGGGGGGGSVTPAPQTGSIEGYAYVPLGSARAAAAPSGYVPWAGADVSVSGTSKTTTTNSNGYYKITGVPTGTRTVTISKTGYESISKAVTVIANTTVTATPANDTGSATVPTETGSIYMTSVPSGATITIDGVATSFTTPHTFQNVKTGNHSINLAREGFKTGQANVSVSSGQTVNAEITMNADLSVGSTRNDNVVEQGITPQATSNFQESNVIQATEGELAILQQIDANALSTQCTPLHTGIGDFLDITVQLYNDSVMGHSRFQNYVSMAPARFTTSASALSPDYIDVFECQEGVFNAYALHRTVFIHPYLANAILEASVLLLMVDTLEEFEFYLPFVAYYNSIGYPLVVVGEDNYNAVLQDEDLQAATAFLTLAGLSYVTFHEIGHANLGHVVQKQRAISGFDPEDQQMIQILLQQTFLNQPFEFQADIFSGNALMALDTDPDIQALEILGGLLVLGLFDAFEDPNANPIYQSHPDPEQRAYVLIEILDGNSLVENLQPLIEGEAFARVAATRKVSKIALPKLPTYEEIISNSNHALK